MSLAATDDAGSGDATAADFALIQQGLQADSGRIDSYYDRLAQMSADLPADEAPADAGELVSGDLTDSSSGFALDSSDAATAAESGIAEVLGRLQQLPVVPATKDGNAMQAQLSAIAGNLKALRAAHDATFKQVEDLTTKGEAARRSRDMATLRKVSSEIAGLLQKLTKENTAMMAATNDATANVARLAAMLDNLTPSNIIDPRGVAASLQGTVPFTGGAICGSLQDAKILKQDDLSIRDFFVQPADYGKTDSGAPGVFFVLNMMTVTFSDPAAPGRVYRLPLECSRLGQFQLQPGKIYDDDYKRVFASLDQKTGRVAVTGGNNTAYNYVRRIRYKPAGTITGTTWFSHEAICYDVQVGAERSYATCTAGTK